MYRRASRSQNVTWGLLKISANLTNACREVAWSFLSVGHIYNETGLRRNWACRWRAELYSIEFRIHSASSDQFVVRAFFCHYAVFQNDDLICIANRTQAVCNGNY